MVNKRVDYQHLLDLHNPDMVIGTESWLNEEIVDNEIFGKDYIIHRRDRGSKGGGIFISVKETYASYVNWKDDQFEMMSVNVIVGKATLQVIGIYKPPRSDLKIMDQLDMYLQNQLNLANKHKYAVTVIGGDMNLPHILWESSVISENPSQELISNFLNKNEFVQTVPRGTRRCAVNSTKSNLLDIFLVTPQEVVKYCEVTEGISDHDAVLLEIFTKVDNSTSRRAEPRTIKLYNKSDVEGITNYLGNSFNTWNSNESAGLEERWEKFKSIVNQAQDMFVPVKKLKHNPDPIYYTPQIRKLQRKCSKLYKTRRYNSIAFKSLNQELLKMKKLAYNKYMSKLLDTGDSVKGNRDSTGNMVWSKFFKHLNQRKGNSSQIPTLVKNDVKVSLDIDKANMLNNQYASVFGKKELFNRENVVDNDADIFTMSNGSIQKVLEGLKSHKAPGLDGISNNFLKTAAKVISPYLRIMFEISIETSLIPRDWKHASVTPIHKGGCKERPDCYRPISLTSSICKVMETLVSKYIKYHLKTNDTLISAQHGFRESHSCDSQLVSLTQEIAEVLDRRGEMDAILIDFSKAFDVVPHKNLIDKINNLGIDCRIVKWIDEWLSGRTQRVRIGGTYSTELGVTSGVPQGSVLGPLLFLVFINDISQNLTCSIRLFADDCILYQEIVNSYDYQNLQDNIRKIEEWVHSNKMKLNSEKSKLIKFTNKRIITYHDYILDNKLLEYEGNCKYLGVILASNLQWSEHINYVVKNGYRKLGFVMRNLKGASEEVREKAYTAIVRPSLEYASPAWDPHTKVLKDAVEKVQRKAARHVLYKYGPRHSPTEMIAELGWEPLENRRVKAKLSSLYKALVGNPAWGDIGRRLEGVQRHGRHDHDVKLFQRGYNTNIGKHSFLNDSIQFWNGLPSDVVHPFPENVETFRYRLNTNMF